MMKASPSCPNIAERTIPASERHERERTASRSSLLPEDDEDDGCREEPEETEEEVLLQDERTEQNMIREKIREMILVLLLDVEYRYFDIATTMNNTREGVFMRYTSAQNSL